jgi:alkaline phosphatase D
MTVLRSVARFGAAFSTIAVRLASFIFLRWIPSHILWPMVIAFWALFILSFIVLLSTDPDLQDPVAQVETSQILQVVTNGATEKVVEVDTLVTRVPKGPPRRVSWMETMYLGIPNPSALLSFATTGVNAVMVLMTLDLAFRRYLFHPEMDLCLHRPVPTSPHSCNIFVRAPPESPMPLQIYYKNVDAEVWNVGPIVWEVSDEMDYTSVVTLEDLIPGTAYQYGVLPRHTDVTAANDTSFGSFETFPQSGSHGRFSFGSSSCIFPGFPYNPTKHPLEIKGLEYLRSDIPNLKFFAFLGSPRPCISS